MPNKRLGQHFLTNKRDVQIILQAADLKSSDTVLEIGPGHGALTYPLARLVKQVIAVEKDGQLFASLRKSISANVRLINRDILDLEQTDIGNYNKVVANIPYYITGAIIKKFANKFCLYLVQREVANRACAKDSKESILSLSIKQWGRPQYIGTIKARSFYPRPKVDSAILKITPLKQPHRLDLGLVKLAFSQKRKQIGNTIDKAWLAKANINPTRRPEDLSLKEWVSLSRTSRHCLEQ